jgi:hypothetical protein
MRRIWASRRDARVLFGAGTGGGGRAAGRSPPPDRPRRPRALTPGYHLSIPLGWKSPGYHLFHPVGMDRHRNPIPPRTARRAAATPGQPPHHPASRRDAPDLGIPPGCPRPFLGRTGGGGRAAGRSPPPDRPRRPRALTPGYHRSIPSGMEVSPRSGWKSPPYHRTIPLGWKSPGGQPPAASGGPIPKGCAEGSRGSGRTPPPESRVPPPDVPGVRPPPPGSRPTTRPGCAESGHPSGMPARFFGAKPGVAVARQEGHRLQTGPGGRAP